MPPRLNSGPAGTEAFNGSRTVLEAEPLYVGVLRLTSAGSGSGCVNEQVIHFRSP